MRRKFKTRHGDTKTRRRGETIFITASPRHRVSASLLLIMFLLVAISCRKSAERPNVRPNTLADVPAERLAYSFTADVDAPPVAQDNKETKLKPIQDDFDSRRKDDRLLRTVVSPDGQRALALYDTGDTQEGEFRVDMYAADGRFLRNITPPELSGAFPATASWSPDGKSFAFIGRKSLTKPTPSEMIPEVRATPSGTVMPMPTPTVAPNFAPVPVFDTEQIYISDRDGFQLRPLTTRNGLIYFYLAWSPDSHALSALACPENEWDAREREHKLPAGRPRLIEVDGRERLLDDGLTDAGPVWSPDSSKIATGFEENVKIYDAVSTTPTQAEIPLRDALLSASAAYDEKSLQSKKSNENSSGKGDQNKSAPAQSSSATPVSFNPIVRLNWSEDKTLYIETAYIRIYANEPVNTFQRWHRLSLTRQAGNQEAGAGSR